MKWFNNTRQGKRSEGRSTGAAQWQSPTTEVIRQVARFHSAVN